MLDGQPEGRGDGPGLVIALKTSPGNRREILMALEEFRRRALTEPGCTACEVLEDVTEHNRFVWTEWWADGADADRAVTQPRVRALLGAVKLLGSVESLEWLSRWEGPPGEPLGAAWAAPDRRAEP